MTMSNDKLMSYLTHCLDTVVANNADEALEYLFSGYL